MHNVGNFDGVSARRWNCGARALQRSQDSWCRGQRTCSHRAGTRASRRAFIGAIKMDWEDHKEVFINFMITFGLPALIVFAFFEMLPNYVKPKTYRTIGIITSAVGGLAPLMIALSVWDSRREEKIKREKERIKILEKQIETKGPPLVIGLNTWVEHICECGTVIEFSAPGLTMGRFETDSVPIDLAWAVEGKHQQCSKCKKWWRIFQDPPELVKMAVVQTHRGNRVNE
jgi:hypothetical protein